MLDAIPQFVKSGLTIATGLMPALGFAVLASMIINKRIGISYYWDFSFLHTWECQ